MKKSIPSIRSNKKSQKNLSLKKKVLVNKKMIKSKSSIQSSSNKSNFFVLQKNRRIQKKRINEFLTQVDFFKHRYSGYRNELIYNNYLIQKFLGILTKKGKKKRALKIMLNLFFYIKQTYKKKPLTFFFKSVINVLPLMTLKNTKLGNKVLKLPCFLTDIQKYGYVFRSLIEYVNESYKNKKLKKKLNPKYKLMAEELVLASSCQGFLWKKKIEMMDSLLENRFNYELVSFEKRHSIFNRLKKQRTELLHLLRDSSFQSGS